jgi:protein-tyrosine-phosphatase
MAQLWAQTAAARYRIGGIRTYSGGTEATEFNPRAVAALERAGFDIAKTSDESNPRYVVRYHPDGPALEAFSKVYDQPPNPQSGYAAVMTCSQADEACPVVLGAEERIAVPYDDPKESDGSGQETAVYDERCFQICTEMAYVFSLLSSGDAGREGTER